jgi:hypothetical protein
MPDTTPVKAADVTKVMRGLIQQATLSTSAAGAGAFAIRMPKMSAIHLGLTGAGAARGRDFLASYLARHLGTPVQITGVETSRKTVRSPGTVTVAIQAGDPR